MLKAIREKGLKIPKDISVIGFDDFEWNDLLDPPLTTISTPVLEMGERSSKLLIKKLRKKQTKPAKSEVLPKLIFRQSTCKPRLKEITNLGH